MAKATQPIIPTPNKAMVKGINEGLKDKRLGEYLNAWVPEVHGALKCEMALLTIQYDPNRIKAGQTAWQEVSRLEKTVVDILGMEEDTLYVVSTVEMHSGRKKKGKGKKEGKEKEEVKEEILSVKTKEDVKGVFKKYNEKMIYEPGEEYLPRLYGYLKNIEGEGKELEMVREYAKLEEMKGGKEASETIYQITIGMINGKKVKMERESEEETLKGYPHIHMAIAFTTRTGVIRDLRTITQKALVYAHDVDIRKKDGTSTKARRGRKVDISNDAKVLGYVFKNARHEETAKMLERYPTTIYNYRNNASITELYTAIYNNTAVIMNMDANPRERIEITQETIKQERTSSQGTSSQTNLGPTVTDKPITKSKKMQMINTVKTYLEKKQMAITPRGTIYQRIKESKKSWKYWGTPQELYAEMCDPENFELLDGTRQQFFTYTTGEFKKLLPYVELDYQWIEFKDFMYNLTTSEIIKENMERQEYESFTYIPETEYGDIYPEIRKKPERWMEILRNSGYIEGDILTEKGKEIIRGVHDIYKPKTHKSKSLVLHGESNSGKSGLIEPIYNLYPKDVRMKITAAGGFELAGLVMRPQIVISDEHDKGRLRRDQTLILVEGDVEMALNIKHRNTETVNVEARSAFICNDIEWAMKEGSINTSSSKSLLTVIDAVTGEEIKPEIDKAYENRMLFCKMNALPEGKRSAVTRREMIEEEKGLIPLYVGKIIYGEKAFRIKEN
jgi:hypothetical protein